MVCPTERKTDMRMTEDRIERIVEREMDKLDKLFLNGGISIERYDEEVAFLDRWASRQYENLYHSNKQRAWG